MWKILVLAVLIDMILFTSCKDSNASCIEEQRNDNYDCSEAIHRAEISLTKLTFQFLSDFLEDRTHPKIGAPISAWFLLGIIALNAENATLNQILNYLELKSKDEAACVMRNALNSVSNDPKDVYFLRSSNVVADNKLSKNEAFKRDINFYDGKAFNLDFSNPEMAADEVNEEVAEKTKNYITNPISKSSASTLFNEFAYLVSVSGIYFRSPWKIAFNGNYTVLDDFYDSQDNVIQARYIFQRAIHKYKCSSKLNAKILRLQMKNNSYNSIFLLPNNKKSGLKSLIQKLVKYPQLLQDELRCMKNKRVDLKLTLHNNNYSSGVVDAREILKKTGEVDLVFDKKTSQLVDNCGNPYNASVTSMIQKARFEIVLDGEEPYNVDESEENTTNSVRFYANSPFIFIIMKNNIPLLCSFSSMGNVVTS